MRNCFISYYSELLKLRHTAALLISIAGAGLIQIIFFMARIFKTEYFIPAEGQNPWDTFIRQGFLNTSALLIPMYIILITSLVMQIEHKAKAWKQLFVMPQLRAHFFWGKLASIVTLLLLTFGLYIAFMILNGYLLGMLKPVLKFQEYSPDLVLVFRISAKLFLVSLSIVALQYWMSLRFKNIVLPMGIGMGFLITGFILINWNKSVYFPYLHPYFSVAEELGGRNLIHYGRLSIVEWAGGLITVGVTGLNYLHYRFWPIRG